MSRQLSAEFRRWSSWYPARWRADSGAAMLGVYLDVAEAEGRERLTAGEKAALVTGGLTARLDGVVPARVRDGVATVMVSLLGAYSLVIGVVFEWAPWGTAGRALWQSALPAGMEGEFGPFLSPTVVVAGLGVLALLLAMTGPDWAYRTSLGATVVGGILVAAAAHYGVIGYNITFRALPALFPVLLALMALPAARPRGSRALIGTLLWLAAFYPAQRLSGAWSLRYFFDGKSLTTDSLFFMVVIGVATAWGAAVLGLLAALVLTIARRLRLAAIVVVSTIPFAALSLSQQSSWGSMVVLGPLFVGYLTAVAIAAVQADRRRRSPATAPAGTDQGSR